MKKYKLLKPIIDVNAGTIFEYKNWEWIYNTTVGIKWQWNIIHFINAIGIDNKEYFEEVSTDWTKRMKHNIGWSYYWIAPDWWIISYIYNATKFDAHNHNAWNAYHTQEEAEKAREKLLTTVFLNDRIAELNGEWKYVKWDIYNGIRKENGRNTLFPTVYSDSHLLLLNHMSWSTANTLIEKYPEKLNLLFDN